MQPLILTLGAGMAGLALAGWLAVMARRHGPRRALAVMGGAVLAGGPLGWALAWLVPGEAGAAGLRVLTVWLGLVGLVFYALALGLVLRWLLGPPPQDAP